MPFLSVLQHFNSDNERFKREDCESCGIDGWVYAKKSKGHFFKRTWICMTIAPRRLVMVRDCEDESELNALGRDGKLKNHLVTIPAVEIGEILSGHGDKAAGKGNQHERDFRITQERSKANANISVSHGLLCIGDVRGRGLPASAPGTSPQAHVAIQHGSHFHRESEPVSFITGVGDASPRAEMSAGDKPEIMFTKKSDLFIMEAGGKKEVQISVLVHDGPGGAERCIGFIEVNIKHLEHGENNLKEWFPVKEHVDKKQKKRKISKAMLQQETKPDLGEVFVRISFANKEEAPIQMEKWFSTMAAADADDDDDGKPYASYDFRTNSIERKDAWCMLAMWMKKTVADPHARKNNFPPSHLRTLPSPDLRPSDAKKCVANPALIDLPFKKAREFIYNLARFKIMGLDVLCDSRDQMLYSLFQLETYAWKKPKADKFFHQSAGQHETGVTIGAYKGLDFKLTMEVLSMVRHGKRNSLPYKELIEESETELGIVALRMIQTAIGAWAFSRRAAYASNTLRVYHTDKAKKNAFDVARDKYKKIEKEGGVEALLKLATDEPLIHQTSIDKALDVKRRLADALVGKMFQAKARAPLPRSLLPARAQLKI